MVLAKTNIWEMYEGLKYNFLYNNDINSIHILLNLYDLENNMTNICPKYISTNQIRKKVKRLLIHRKDRQLISNNVALLIHEDIDRLELTLYLEGYNNGYYNNKWVNMLEDVTIKFYSIEEIYEKNFLFHYDIAIKDVREIKESFELEMDDKESETLYLYDFIETYCEKIIKEKIYNLNMYIDKQLTIEYNLDETNIQDEETFLSANELNKIYKAVVNTIIKNTINMYKDASWFGINDRVLNRYK